MQTATILYRTRATPDRAPAPTPEAAAAAGLDPAWTELAEGGPRRINEALLQLVTRGAGRVEAVPFRQDEAGALHLGAPRLRLFG